MHITLETDYAIRIVDIIARNKLISQATKKPHRLDAKTISEQTDVPPRFALKILHKLATAEIVKSYKGKYGGYELSCELADLSLYDVVELVEGKYRLSRCLNDDYSCSCNCNDELPCTYQKVFGEITEEVCSRLKKQTFDRLVIGETDSGERTD